jgi:hypothetical protein
MVTCPKEMESEIRFEFGEIIKIIEDDAFRVHGEELLDENKRLKVHCPVFACHHLHMVPLLTLHRPPSTTNSSTRILRPSLALRETPIAVQKACPTTGTSGLGRALTEAAARASSTRSSPSHSLSSSRSSSISVSTSACLGELFTSGPTM